MLLFNFQYYNTLPGYLQVLLSRGKEGMDMDSWQALKSECAGCHGGDPAQSGFRRRQ